MAVRHEVHLSMMIGDAGGPEQVLGMTHHYLMHRTHAWADGHDQLNHGKTSCPVLGLQVKGIVCRSWVPEVDQPFASH